MAAVNATGPLQVYEVPPVAFNWIVAAAQYGPVLLADGDGKGLTVTFTVPVAVQLLLLVTVIV